MEKEKFTLKPCANMMWTVKDEETGITIDFREGLFNETQVVNIPADSEEKVRDLSATEIAGIMSSFGDWLAENHSEVVCSRSEARCRAIWLLGNERYWLAFADMMNALLVDWEEENASFRLFAEVDDYLDMYNGVGLTDSEVCNLRGSVSMLADDEAMEVVDLVYVFWKYKEHEDIQQWTRDLQSWPSWCPTNPYSPLFNDDQNEEGGNHGED